VLEQQNHRAYLREAHGYTEEHLHAPGNGKKSARIVFPMMKLHHIGCLVDDIEASKKMHKDVLKFTNISETVYVPSQKVYVCFIEVGNGTYLELIQPLDETSPLLKFRQKNVNYYHLAYLVKNIDTVVDELCSKDAILLTSFASEAFNQKKSVFLYSPERNLIELIDDS